MAKVLIVGAGAAGLMAAGAAVRQGHQVTVLEHMDKPGQKILVTGKGRCNVTNDCPAEEFLRHVRTNPRFLYSSLGAFPPAKTMELFEGLGVELKVERGRRVFPVSDKAEEIRQALLRYAQDADIVYDGAKKLLLEDIVPVRLKQELVILCFNLEVALWVVADWANLRSLLAYYDMSAVRALPDAVAVTREDELVLYVLQELAITLLMMLLDFSNHLKLSCNLLETFFASLLCHAWIHIGPLIVLTIGSSFQVLLCILDSTALQILEPQLSVLLLVSSCLLKDISYLYKTVLLCLACKIGIFVTSL